ncbi:hypothetical protein RYU24_06730 [Acinetobacter variabilis]|nr:hypothetical protein RYU24_06730 [Acinetobacter variabilis]
MPTKLAVKTRNFELVAIVSVTAIESEDAMNNLTLTKNKKLSFKSVIFLKKA